MLNRPLLQLPFPPGRRHLVALALCLLQLAFGASAATAAAKRAALAKSSAPAKSGASSRHKSAQPPVESQRRTAGKVPAAREPSPAQVAASQKAVPPELRALGPLSVGHPSAGYLINSVPMPRSEHWVLTTPDHGFATAETVSSLSHCLNQVHERFPLADPTPLGSLSAARGGKISPHKSHRTGRDADVYFFRKAGARWSRAATEADIELQPTWALLRCFITDSDVDMILIDRRVQGWLEAYALSHGEDKTWVQGLFHDQKQPHQMALVRHEPGHVAHMHVRFASPDARRAGVLAYDRLVAAGLVVPKLQALAHQVKKGETLSEIASKFGVSVARIRELNGLTSNLIRVGQELTLQRSVDILGARDPVGIAPRRRPPSEPKAAVASELPSDTSQPKPSASGGRYTAEPESSRSEPSRSELQPANTMPPYLLDLPAREPSTAPSRPPKSS